jgi:DNA polymerase
MNFDFEMTTAIRAESRTGFLYLAIFVVHMDITLRVIEKKVSACQLCPLYRTAHKGVPGEGPRKARVFLVGQAPGAEEDKSGRPFVGRSGKFLTEQLDKIGIDRKDVFITSVVKHFPPGNRMPTRDEAAACRPYLLEQIALVDPEVVVLMGALAQSIRDEPVLQDRKVIEMPHPAAAMRFPRLRRQFEAKLAVLKHILK